MISLDSLKTVITSVDVVYQPINCLIDVANADKFNMRNIISNEISNDNWRVLSKNEALNEGFEELAEWSTEDDYLIAIELQAPINDEYYILVCLPKKEFSIF